MFLAEFRRSLRNGDRAGARRRGLTKPKRCCLGLEKLEDRVVMTTSTWSGARAIFGRLPGTGTLCRRREVTLSFPVVRAISPTPTTSRA